MYRIVLNETSYFGAGCRSVIADEVAKRGFKKAFFVTDKDLIKFGVAAKIEEVLNGANIPYEIYSDVKANPTIGNVQRGVEAYKASGADFIIALGGGSSIDTAKAVGIIVNNPEFADVRSLEGVAPTKHRAVPTFAIPTTAGTAAEVTINYVITDEEAKKKMVCVDPNDIPMCSIIDCELMYSMPKGLTAATGMDALTHAIEAFVSTVSGAFTDPLAIQAIEMIFDYLPESYSGNMVAREQMHNAQCLAGMAFSNALLGIVHSMAHKTGAAFSTGHIPHGCANAMYLPFVIKYNAGDSKAASRYAEIARRVGLDGVSEKALINSLCDKIESFNRFLGIPKTLKEFGIIEDEFKEKIAKISELAVGDACTGSIPRAIDPATMEKLFTCVYYGTEIDF
jgi:lactaldehyde reductase